MSHSPHCDDPPAEATEVENPCPAAGHHDPVEGQPVWCRPCADRITRAIGRLPELAAALFERTIGDGGKIAATGQTEGGSKGKRIVSPSGSPAWDAVDELVAWAGDLEDRLRGHLHHAPAAHDYWIGDTTVRATTLTTSVTYLTTWATALLSSPLAVNAGQQATALERRAERAAGLDRLAHRLPAPCPSCDRKALVRDDGSEQVDCKACGRSWPEADYRRLTLVLASDHGGSVRPVPRQPIRTSREGSGRSHESKPDTAHPDFAPGSAASEAWLLQHPSWAEESAQ